ncbi:methionine aminopeptidase [Bacillus mesophilum]|uniref:Methionine aminopeptidase n=1 Tax=Bacillus mesophilum TaxID=1071718 RepID=A0A7V7UVK3_9BACI|nr:methionine aminopeptidase [Bacillus mesophilum]KAB2333441.1 methionine aminopeptidase [Bacillus mesophilum]
MGLFGSFQKWKNAKYEEHMSRMKEDNKCPDCNGRGFLIFPASMYLYNSESINCHGCNGTGLYTDWGQSGEL